MTLESGKKALWPTPEGDVEVTIGKVTYDIKQKKEYAEVKWPSLLCKGEILKATIETSRLKEIG